MSVYMCVLCVRARTCAKYDQTLKTQMGGRGAIWFYESEEAMI